MNLPALKRLVSVWQERLKLLDWDIVVRWITPEEQKEYTYGYCDHDALVKKATLAVAKPSTYSEEDSTDPSKDVEVFVVHELLHCHLAVFETQEGTALAIAEENIVNLVSRLMIAIDRRDDLITGRKLSKRASLRKPVACKEGSIKESSKETPFVASEEAES